MCNFGLSRREESVNQIARRGKWFSIVCVLGSAVVSSVSPSFADDQSPCRVIGDKVNPRFAAVWVADDGIWAADDLNHSLILYDRLSGKEKKRIQGFATGLDFPAAVQVDLSFKLAGGKQGLIWASMNDTADRVTAYAEQDVDSTDTSPVDLGPAAVIRFNTIRFDGRAIYRRARVYGFHVEEQNDEIALGFEKGDFIDADGHASLGSVVIVNRGGADFSQLGTGKRWIQELDVSERHELRKALKNIRYSIEYFGSLSPGRKVKPFIRRVKCLQDIFGYLNDAATATKVVSIASIRSTATAPCREAAGYALGWHTAHAEASWKNAQVEYNKLRDQDKFWR
jgi:hypothetical protein